MKKLIIFISFLTIFSFSIFAESQWDISLSFPYYAGIETDDGGVGEFSDYLFVMPDVKWNYYFGSEQLHFGVGMRLWTLLIESAMYPIVSVESNIGNWVFNANVGGGVFLLFGIVNSLETSSLVIPDISVAYKFGKKKIFSVGTGAMFLLSPEFDGLAFVGTGFVRATF